MSNANEPQVNRERLTNEQLVTLIRAGENEADTMLKLWQQNQGYIGKIAMSYQAYEDIEDLKQQGYIGLCHAVNSYRPDEGVLFMSYAAFWIRQSMQRYIEDCGSVVRIPANMRQSMRKYKKMVSLFQSQFGRKPTDREACLYLDVSYNRLEELKKGVVLDNMGSLDIPIGEEQDCSLYDVIPGSEGIESTVLDKVQQEELKALIWPLVDALPGKAPEVIRARFLDGKTLKETGQQIGTNIEAARQWQEKGFRELRKPAVRKKLIPFVREDERIYSRGLVGNGVGAFNRTWTSSTERAAIDLF